MIECFFCAGNIILISVIIVVLCFIIISLFYGASLMKQLKKIEKKWKEYRTAIDNEFFEKWKSFLRDYQKLISKMQKLRKVVMNNEKKYFKYSNYEEAIRKIRIARDVKESRWFRNKSIKKSLKTRMQNIVFDTNPQRRNQLLENFSYGYCKIDVKGIFRGLLCGTLMCIVGFIVIDSIVREGIVKAFFWKYWLFVIIFAVGLLVCLIKYFGFIVIGLLVENQKEGSFKFMIECLVCVVCVVFIVPIIISIGRALIMNITTYIYDLKHMLNIFWILFALVYICIKFLFHIVECNKLLKKECDNRIYDLEDLKKEEKMDNYREAFGENGCIEIYLDNVQQNINNLEKLVSSFKNEKDTRKKGQIFSDIYPDFKILEELVLTRSIQNDYYNSFEKIIENNRIIEKCE